MIKNEEGRPYFYKITNKLNGKYYYGSGQSDGYYGSGFALKRAYEKYGKDQFKYEVLRYFDTREDAFRFEQLFLSIFKLDIDPKSYNTCRNANGGYISKGVYDSNREFLKKFRQTEEGSIKGLKNPRADQTIYEFYNIDTWEYRKSTVHDMNRFVNGEKPGTSVFGYIVRGDHKMYKGWILASNIDKWGTRQLLKEEHRKNMSISKRGKKVPKISNAKKGVKWWHNPLTGETSLSKEQRDGFIAGRKPTT